MSNISNKPTSSRFQSEEDNAQQADDYEAGKQMKQAFLIKQVMEAGYDANAFAQYLTEKKDDGINIDKWTFNGLVEVVREFRLIQDGQHTSTLVQQSPNQSPLQSPQLVTKTSNEEDYIDVNDGTNFDQFSTTEFPDCPQIKQRDFIDATTIQESQTQINFKKVTIKVSGYHINKGAYFFQGDYTTFQIETEISGEQQKLRVTRKDQDFYTLRRFLKIQFPYVLVPPLPSTAKKYMKLINKTLSKRRVFFQRFLQAVSRSEVLKSSAFLMDFLSEKEPKQWDLQVKKQEKAKVSKKMSDLVSPSGQVNVQILQSSIIFCNKLQTTITSQQVQYQEAIDISKDINLKCQNLTNSVQSLSACFERIAELNGMVKLTRKQELFEWLARILSGTGENIINTGELVKLYCGSHMKYHLAEQDTLKELMLQRDGLEKEYLKRERALYLKKDKLFQSKNPQKWGFSGSQEELAKRAEELFLCKAKAFKFMLSDETLQINELREELSFYTNQCQDEVQRVGSDDAELLTDHFITQSQLQCTYINQFHVLWAQFMSHFAEVGGVEEGQNLQELRQSPEIREIEPRYDVVQEQQMEYRAQVSEFQTQAPINVTYPKQYEKQHTPELLVQPTLVSHSEIIREEPVISYQRSTEILKEEVYKQPYEETIVHEVLLQEEVVHPEDQVKTHEDLESFMPPQSQPELPFLAQQQEESEDFDYPLVSHQQNPTEQLVEDFDLPHVSEHPQLNPTEQLLDAFDLPQVQEHPQFTAEDSTRQVSPEQQEVKQEPAFVDLLGLF